MYRVCTEYIPIHTGKKCMFCSTYLRLKVCTRYILLVHKMVCTGMYSVHTGMYSVHTSTYFFSWFGTAFLSFLQGTYGHILRISDYILYGSCVFCWPAWACWFACRWFMPWNTHSTKAHCIRFSHCCLAAPLPVPASAWHHDSNTTGRLRRRGLAGGCSCSWSALHDLLSSSCQDDDQWPAHQRYQPEPVMHCDLGFKLWRWWWAVIGMSRM